MLRSSSFIAVLLTALSLSLAAQWPATYSITGPTSGGRAGQALAFIGDVDGDGRDDFAVASPFDFPNGPSSGSVRIYSGATGGLIRAHAGLAPGDEFGSAIAGLDDQNGDGRAEYVIGAHLADGYAGLDCGAIYFFDGATGTTAGPVEGSSAGEEYGSALARAGDLTGDGLADLLVGAAYNSEFGIWSGRVWVLGVGSAPYPILAGTADYERFGQSVSGAGDVDGDGHADFVIGVPGDSSAGQIYAGSARVHSGATGALLHVFHGDSPFDAFGHAVAGAGDLNGDGRADIVVGAIQDDDFGANSGSVRAFSGRDGSVLYTIHGNIAGANFGHAIAGAGDTNGDGFDDFIVGAPFDTGGASYSGSAQLHSGSDGSLIVRFSWPHANQYCGTSVAGGGDLDADGFGDVLIGIPYGGAVQEGMAVAHAAPRLPVLEYRSDLSLVHELDVDWLPTGGNPLALDGTLVVSLASPGGAGSYGASLARIDYPAFGWLPLLIAVDPVNLLETGYFGFDILGQLVAPGISRRNPWIAGWQVHVQFFETSPVIASSPGIRLTMVP